MRNPPFHRVLVGWDASPSAEAGLRTALALAGMQDGHVVALAVLPYPAHTETDGERNRALAAARDRVQRRFDEVRESLRSRRATLTLEMVESAHVAEALQAHAVEHGFDLLVLGRHGQGSARHPKLGHVAEAAARWDAAPVLLTNAE